MKDIHNHILYGIDDGSNSLEQSLELLKEIEQEGVTDIIVTPHYIIGTDYNSNNKEKSKLLDNLKNKTNINLYLGNEIFIDNDIIKYIKDGKICTLNNTRYMLVEFPLSEKLSSYMNILFELRKEGFVPVIAHPERYHYLKIEDLVDLVDSGCLLQGNITSLCGRYGKAAKKNLELLLKKHMIHFLGTDTHSHVSNINQCLNRLEKLVDKEMYNDLVSNNFDKLICDKKIVPYEIVETGTFFKKEVFK